MPEYALLQKGHIVDVVTSGSVAGAQAVADHMEGPVAVRLLDLVPDHVRQGYRYWSERP